MLIFEWDEGKNRRNRHKHGIDFEQACRVFDDPGAVTTFDCTEAEEERWQILGRVGPHTLLMVAYVIRSSAYAETIRIISARRAVRYERQRYEKESS